ncbi:Coiled-coil domain-containing protein 96, partial [Chytridiales sp. JEL 0842]
MLQTAPIDGDATEAQQSQDSTAQPASSLDSAEPTNLNLRSETEDLKSLEDVTLNLQSPNTDDQDPDAPDLEVGDEIEIIPATQRTLTSPVPTSWEGFTFLNVNYEDDSEGGIVDVGAVVAGGLVGGLEQEEEEENERMEGESGEEVQPQRRRGVMNGLKTPMLRPSTPTVTIELKQEDISNPSTDDPAANPTDDPTNPSDADPTTTTTEEGLIDREELIAKIKLSLDAREKHKAKNTFLQNKLGEYFRRKRGAEDNMHGGADGEKSATDQEARYANCMAALETLRVEFEVLSSTNQKVVNECQVKLEERTAEADEKANEFWKFKRGVALAAENSRTGKGIPVKAIEQLEATEARKEAEVTVVRLENIKLRNKLKRHEQLLRQKEELADGLHLIDFEQLKIENQTYNEKIEERNEELLKLRKKITNIVQVLTHVKEKLQFVQGENVGLKKDLKGLDHDVSARRDSLPLMKQKRDALRANNLLLRQKNGLLGNNALLRDFEDKVDEADRLKAQIDELRAYHANLSAETLSIKRRIQ